MPFPPGFPDPPEMVRCRRARNVKHSRWGGICTCSQPQPAPTPDPNDDEGFTPPLDDIHW